MNGLVFFAIGVVTDGDGISKFLHHQSDYSDSVFTLVATPQLVATDEKVQEIMAKYEAKVESLPFRGYQLLPIKFVGGK